MIELLVEDGEFGQIESQEPFLVLDGKLYVSVADTGLRVYDEPIGISFFDIALSASDTVIETDSDDVQIRAYPISLAASDTVIDCITAGTKVVLSPLPAGMWFLQSGENVYILGTPEPGTEGDYKITLVADNDVEPNAQQTILLTVRQIVSTHDQ